MQNFGVTNKEHYGMLWYFLKWSMAHTFFVSICRCNRDFTLESSLFIMMELVYQCTMFLSAHKNTQKSLKSS